MSKRSFRSVLRKLGAGLLALACLALPAPFTAVANQESGSSSAVTDEPTYDEMMNGGVGPVSKFDKAIQLDSSLEPRCFTSNCYTAGETIPTPSLSISAVYTHLYGDKTLAATATGKATTRRTSVVTDFALTLAKGTYNGKTLTVTLPQNRSSATVHNTPTFSLASDLSTKILGAVDPTTHKPQELATCKTDSSDNQKLVCTFGSTGAPVTVSSAVNTVLSIQYTPTYELTGAERNKMIPWDFNGYTTAKTSAGNKLMEGNQTNTLNLQTPTVKITDRTEQDFTDITSQTSSYPLGVRKQGSVSASDYGNNKNIVLWAIYMSQWKLFNKDGQPAIIYENAGSPSDTVNSNGTIKNPNEVTGADLDYRLRLFPSMDDFTPKVRWTTKAGWLADTWYPLTGCIYRTKDINGNSLKTAKDKDGKVVDNTGWHKFSVNGTTDTNGVLGGTCVPYSANADQPDYTVGVQEGGHGFQIWFNPESKTVQTMKSHDSDDFVLEAYYETLPVDVTQRYIDKTTEDHQKNKNQWALYNRVHVTYDDKNHSNITTTTEPLNGTSATYTTAPKNGERYTYGPDGDTNKTKYPEFVQWLPQYWDPGDNPGVKMGTLNLHTIDRASALGSTGTQGAASDQSSELDPSAETGSTSKRLLRLKSTSDDTKDLISAYNPAVVHSGYKNPAWFQLAYSQKKNDTSDSNFIPLTGNTDVVTTATDKTGTNQTDGNALYSGTDGKLSLAYLVPGTYRLYPTIAPAGYAIMPTSKTASGEAKDYYYEFTVADDGNITDVSSSTVSAADSSAGTNTAQAVTAVIPYNRIYATVHIDSPKLEEDPGWAFWLTLANDPTNFHGLKLNNTAASFGSAAKGYVTRQDASVISPGSAAGNVTKACSASSDNVCDSVAVAGEDNSAIINVPWTSASDTAAKDATLIADNSYAGAAVTKNSASATNEQLKKKLVVDDQDGMKADFSITRADLVKAANTYSGTTASAAKIHTVKISLTLDSVSFKIPVVDAAKMIQTNSKVDSGTLTFVGNELVNIPTAGGKEVSSQETCNQVQLEFTSKADSSKVYEASSAATAPIKVAWEEFTDGAGTTSSQCVVSGKLPIGTYTVTEKKSPTAYATTTSFQVALGNSSQNTDNHDTDGVNVYVAITDQSLSDEIKRNQVSSQILGDDYKGQEFGKNRSDIPFRKTPAGKGTQVFPLQRLGVTLHYFLYNQITKEPVSAASAEGVTITPSQSGISEAHPTGEFGLSFSITNYAGYSVEQSQTCPATVAANEICQSRTPWSTEIHVKNNVAAAGYTLAGATANSTLQSDQTSLGLLPGLLNKTDGTAYEGSEGVDASSSFSYTVTPQLIAKAKNTKGLFVNIYEKPVIMTLPLTGGQKALAPIIIALLALLAGVLMAIAQRMRRRVTGDHIRR